MIHLGVQRPLGQRLLQIVEKAVGVKCRLRVRAAKQLVKQRVRYPGALRRAIGNSFDPLCPPAHEIPDSPRCRA